MSFALRRLALRRSGGGVGRRYALRRSSRIINFALPKIKRTFGAFSSQKNEREKSLMQR
jgi:hypothetical protein